MPHIDATTIDRAIHGLEGYLKGIALDGIITAEEARGIRQWREMYAPHAERNPFNEIIPVIDAALADRVLLPAERRDILWLCANFSTGNLYFNLIQSDIQRLKGMFRGILADGRISTEEIRSLAEWLEESQHLTSTYPYDEIKAIVATVLEDGTVDRQEQKFLKVFFAGFVDLADLEAVDPYELRLLKQQISIPGICALKPTVSIAGQVFCLTGQTSRSQAREFARAVTDHGGIFQEEPGPTTNYLVVRDQGNQAWAFACSGRKIEMAQNLRKSGKRLNIILEKDFWNSVPERS